MRKGQINLIVCFVAVVVLPSSFGLIEEMKTPRDILECLIYKSQNTSIGEVSGRIIQDFCIRKYTLDTQSSKENFAKNITTEGVQYLKSLFRQLESEVREQKRGKRQLETWRYRREIRTLSPAERNRVFRCFRRLKGDYVRIIILYLLFSFLIYDIYFLLTDINKAPTNWHVHLIFPLSTII